MDLTNDLWTHTDGRFFFFFARCWRAFVDLGLALGVLAFCNGTGASEPCDDTSLPVFVFWVWAGGWCLSNCLMHVVGLD